jgi:hypothetical protein
MGRVRVKAKMIRSGGEWFRRGDRPDLPKEEVDRLVPLGGVEPLDGGDASPSTDGSLGLPDTLDGLREFAAERDISIPSSARTKPQITEVIETALNGGGGDE